MTCNSSAIDLSLRKVSASCRTSRDCDAASNSEIVLPLRHNNEIIAVLDIDSPLLARFDSDDQAGLQQLISLFEQHLAATL